MGYGPRHWGRDHYSVLLYIETCCVDGHGRPDGRHVQANHNRHPMMGNPLDGAAHGIRLADRVLPGPDYDEWDCLDDFETYGLIENIGTGLQRRYRLTDTGKAVAAQIRGHRADGGGVAGFEPDWTQTPAGRMPDPVPENTADGAVPVAAGRISERFLEDAWIY